MTISPFKISHLLEILSIEMTKCDKDLKVIEPNKKKLLRKYQISS